MLKELIQRLLMQATKHSLTSISIPALGTGVLGFPADVVANIMYSTCVEYATNNSGASIKTITFVIYERDQSTINVSKTC